MADKQNDVVDDKSPNEPSVQTGEHLGEPQPEAPNPIPAVSGIDQDAVSINRYLEEVEQRLSAAKNYVQTFLQDHKIADKVVQDIEKVVNNIRKARL